ncbi:pectinesterase family protein [Hymenobacter lucidus]|uniref:T9SS type A sorting domain-containing protein n=1 Tax=Hymenobacter lucidus TaxID=2880930 RepID=A0ABS8AU37_9BACT|nr:pectinesterase family protein [Hymenobacter lucidus]MCB2408924.1 T9SS type A sorting domain-containing protein [Hymenobacter lucidus]
MKHVYSQLSRLAATLLLLLLAFVARAQTYDAIVAKDGSGAFRTVQAAIDAAPTARTTAYTIYIKNGKYKEKISVPSNKPFLQLIGQSVANTILTYDDFSGKPNPAGGTFGTSNSASVTINATDFSALNITFENTTGDSPQALAINVSADRAAFKNCRFLGGQDTVLTNGSGRQYFKDCYIDGTVDFIFGGARALFEGCIIYPKTRRDGGNGGYITAANTPQGQTYGYVFRKCYIPANRGLTTYTMGRPWQNSGTPNPTPAHNKVVWISAVMGPNIIKPEGWSAWDAGTNTSVITYAEYKSRDVSGNLVDVSQRVPWSKQLTEADTALYSRTAVLGDWNPCAAYANFCPSQPASIAVANFMGVKGAATTPTALSWNASWPIAGVQYQVFRSTTRRGTYAPLYTTTAANATDVNFATTDAIPTPGNSYFYYVQASKTGLATHLTDTLQISSTPTVTVTGALQSFLQGGGQPSAAQRFQVIGENLTAGLIITPPANFQVSADGSTWFSSTAPLTLTPTSTGAVASTPISVRLNAASVGTYSGNLTLTSTGAVATSLPVTGTTQAAALPQSANLQWWPMTRNNQDSVAVRSARLVASTPTFRKFVLSDGSATATIPPYSARYGQAFAPIATGSWLSSNGGNGSNLNRTYYEQFTVTGTAGTTVRVDSVLLDAFVTGSTSNTKLALVWSRSGFATDSADVTGGRGPAGTLLSTANGGFTTPIFTTGALSTYRLALAGAAGVTLQPGQRLTFRLYFSCGSTSAATRFATLRNVIIRGEAGVVTSTQKARSGALQVYPNPVADQLTLTHPAAAGVAEVAIYTLLGQRVRVQPCAAGSRQTLVNLEGLSSGQYVLRYSTATEQFTTPISKQ